MDALTTFLFVFVMVVEYSWSDAAPGTAFKDTYNNRYASYVDTDAC